MFTVRTFRSFLATPDNLSHTNINISTTIIGPAPDMSTNKFEALGSDDSEGDEGMNNHNNQPLEVCYHGDLENLS